MTTDTAPLVLAARERVAALRERSDEIERGRRVPADLAAELASAGFFRMLAPASLGGEEVTPAVFVRVLETLATGDSAAAWCVMTGATTGLVTAYLDEDGAREVWGDGDAVLAGVFAPFGRVEPRPGGYWLSGRWPFASGCENATWRLGGAIVEGTPRALFFRADESRVVDTWKVAGLRGTGSHDLEVAGAFVPERRCAAVVGAEPRHHGALFTFPLFGLLALGVAAVGLGIARAAVDDLAAQLGRGAPNGRRRADDSLAQVAHARAEGRARAARAVVYQALAEVWEHARAAAASGTTLPVEDRAALRLAASDAAALAAEAVDLAYHAGGGAVIYEDNPLQRHLRDIHTMTQHVMVGERTRKLVGRVLLGIPCDTGQL